jgi:hypothetical protein
MRSGRPRFLQQPCARARTGPRRGVRGAAICGRCVQDLRGDGNGGVIVSQTDQPVEFAPLLTNRVANLVPIDDLNVAISAVTAYTQTIGIYPDELIPKIRDQLADAGAQRLVTLGYLAPSRSFAGPQDGMEPMRRMCNRCSCRCRP